MSDLRGSYPLPQALGEIVGRYEELRDDTVAAYEEATGSLPDTRDYVALEDAVKDYVSNEENSK